MVIMWNFFFVFVLWIDGLKVVYNMIVLILFLLKCLRNNWFFLIVIKESFKLL